MAGHATKGTSESEISNLKDKYGTSLRLIHDFGEFKYLLKLEFRNYGVTVRLHVRENYPDTVPAITVTSKTHQPSTLEPLRSHIHQQLTITSMLKSADKWLYDHPLLVQKTKTSPKETKKRRKKTKTTKESDEESSTKKPSMKTALDVISRIQWDSSLQADEFTVGYLDRFVGITEKSFTVLSWEDPCAVDDYEALAIPKHRIEYFKYRQFKVWDKPSRTDYVFGSSGEKRMTIYDVMKRYDDLMGNVANVSKVEDDSEHVEDDSSDDGIQVTIRDDNSEEDAESSHWENKLRPNYFVAVRIQDPEVVSMVEHVQDTLVTRQSLYETCCIPVTALHVTVCTLRLDSSEQVAEACRALKELHSELGEKSLRLKFDGMGNFCSRVLYAKVHYEEDFLKLVDDVKLALRTSGVDLRDGQDFVPHLTVMKTTRPVSRLTGSRTIPKSVYEGSEDVNFGEQRVDNLYLCSMEEQWTEDGFYRSPLKLDL